MNNGELDSRFQEDQRVGADTAVGRFSVGVSGITDDVRRNATRGDLELGYFYYHEFNTLFPRIAEVRPFIFNRVDSTDTAYYESLGIGAGVRFSLRNKYEENNWFVRLSSMTPTELYRERYGLDQEHESIIEMFAGFEFKINPVSNGRDVRGRVTPPRVIRLTVPAAIARPQTKLEPGGLRVIHAKMIGQYLAKVWQLQDDRDAFGRLAETDWPVLFLIDRLSEARLTQTQRRALDTDFAILSEDELARRRAAVARFLRSGLRQMMRGGYPLVIVTPQQVHARPKAQEGRGNDESGTTDTQTISVARMSRPGMALEDSDDPLDVNTMIEHYIAVYCDSLPQSTRPAGSP